jgi:hypothetical protein
MHHGIVEDSLRGIRLEVVDKEIKLEVDGIKRSVKVTHSSLFLFRPQIFFIRSFR